MIVCAHTSTSSKLGTSAHVPPACLRICLPTCVHVRVQIILELESILMKYQSPSDIDSKKSDRDVSHDEMYLGLKFGWKFYLWTILSRQMPYTEYPLHLHQLSPKKKDWVDANDRLPKQMEQLTQSVSHLQDDVKLETIRTKQTEKLMEERVGELHDDMTKVNDNMANIMTALARMEGMMQQQQTQMQQMQAAIS
jgi:hypothetical protein